MVYSFEVDDWEIHNKSKWREKKMAGNEKTGPEHDGRIIHKHTHSLSRMRSQARQPKRLQGLSCVPTIRASRADTAWQTKLTPRTSGACSSAQLPEHAM